MRTFALASLLLGASTLATATPPERLRYPTVQNDAWRRGERLTFQVKFGPLHAGSVVMAVEDEITFQGRPTYRVRFGIRSLDFFFYSVRDNVITYMDRQGLFTQRYEKHLREGTYRNDEVTTFNHERGVAERTKNGQREPNFEFPRFAKDVLGAIYWLRTQRFDVGDVLRIPVSDGRKNYDMEIHVQARQRVRVPAGEFTTLLVEPKLESEGIFVRKGRIFVWLTDDTSHIPVRVKTVVPVGEVVANLESMRGTL